MTASDLANFMHIWQIDAISRW